MGELLNGLTQVRRLEDTFALTQCIETSVAQKRALWITFLDMKGAYDKAGRESLSDILNYEGIDDNFVELLREMYRNNRVQFVWEGQKCNKLVETHQ